MNADSWCANALPGIPSDPFAERLQTDSWFRQSVLRSSTSQGKNPLRFLPGFDALDALYRGRSTEIKIKSELTARRGMAFPVAYLARQSLEGTLPGLNNIDWAGSRFDANGQLVLFKKILPVNDDAPAQATSGGFPDLLLIVDSSGSMAWDPCGGKGAYDALLRAIYSVFRFLEEQHKAPHMRFAVVNFSGKTEVTSWRSFAELRTVKEALFKHQGGGTVLDCAALDAIARESKDHFLSVMVTDGQIGNAQAVADTIGRIVARGHGFVMIQIGGVNPMTQLAQQLGIPVHLLSDCSQLNGLCLDIAQRTWGRGR
jgi:hypothetical protein